MEQILLGACKHLDFRPLELWGKASLLFSAPFLVLVNERPGNPARLDFENQDSLPNQKELVVVSTGNLVAGTLRFTAGIDAQRLQLLSRPARAGLTQHHRPGGPSLQRFLSPLWRLGRPRSRPWQTGCQRPASGSRTPSSWYKGGEAGLRGSL